MTDLCLYVLKKQEIAGILIYAVWQDLKTSLRNGRCYNQEEGATSFKPWLTTRRVFPAICFKTQCAVHRILFWKATPPMGGLTVTYRQIKAKQTDSLWRHLWQQKLIVCYYEKADIYNTKELSHNISVFSSLQLLHGPNKSERKELKRKKCHVLLCNV